MPDGEHDKQKRKRHVDEKPTVEPVMQAHLQIEHAAFIAPGLDLFDAAPISFGDAQLHKAKGVVRKTRIVQAHSVAPSRP